MTETISLTPIPTPIRPERTLDIVFVHGVGDNDIDAWQHENDPSTFWPRWLAEQFPSAQVWMLRYASSKFWWEQPAALALPDRAKSIISFLVDNKLGHRDLLFITHSLGGLMVKQALALSKMGIDARFETIAKATRGVVFLATPHTGSNLAVVANALGIASRAIADLQTDDPWLRLLKDWYRNNAPQFAWKTRAFHETQRIKGQLVVSVSSADPNVEGIAVDPVDADHIDICKPHSRQAPVYLGISTFIEEILTTRRPNTTPPAQHEPPIYITAPALPLNYVERSGTLAELRHALTADRIRPSIPVIALQGMAGLGKTILAQALCHDAVMQQAFPNGVIWLSMGKESAYDLVSKLQEVGRVLGDAALETCTTELGCKNRYKTVMREKSALVVLDDVWRAHDVEPFRANSPNSRLFFTARDTTLAAGIGAETVDPQFLTSDESRTMLATWSGLPDAQMPSAVNDLIRECGGLPLALAMIGAMVRGEPIAYWEDLHQKLKNASLADIEAEFPDYPHPTLLRALQVSVDTLKDIDPRAYERYVALAVLLEDTSIHPLIQQALWDANEADARDTVKKLVRLALAQRSGNDGSIRMHDLLLDYVRAQYPDHTALELIHGAMRLSSHVIERDPMQFASQLVGRLLPYTDISEIQRFIEKLGKAAPRPWLRPIKPALEPPGTGLRSILEGHAHWVIAVALTPDGRHAVSASWDTTLRVWDIESGRTLHILEGHADEVSAVALTPDGRRAVSASHDRTLRVWDVETGRILHTLEGHTYWVTDVALTPDGRRAVSASWDRTLRVWDVETGRALHILEGHADIVTAVALTPDARRAVSASNDRTLRVWDLESGRVLHILEDHADIVTAVALTPDGRRAVSASNDRTLRVWNLESGRHLRTLEGHAHWVTTITLTPDGRRAVSASLDHTLRVWDLESGRQLRTLEGHAGWVTTVALTPDGHRAVSTSHDRTLRVWDVDSGRHLHTLEGHAGWVTAVALTPDGRRTVSASWDRTLRVWDLDSGRALRALEGHAGTVTAVALTPDGRRAVSVSEDCTLRVWDVESGRHLRTLEGHADTVTAVALTPDGRRAVSASRDCTLRVWDVESGRHLRTLEGHADIVTAVALTPDARRAVSVSEDCTLRVWDLESDRQLRTLEGHTGEVTAVALTPDGRRAVSVSEDCTLRIWDLDSGRPLHTLEGHADRVTSVALTPDGRRAISASNDCTLRVWDVDSGAMIATFSCNAAAMCCSFVNDSVVITADRAGQVHILALED